MTRRVYGYPQHMMGNAIGVDESTIARQLERFVGFSFGLK